MANDEAHVPERVRALAQTLWEEAGRPEQGWRGFIQQARSEVREGERFYDKTLADSYPASDPRQTRASRGPASTIETACLEALSEGFR